MPLSIISHFVEEPKPIGPFDTTHTVETRMAGVITIDANHLEWTGSDVVNVTIPGLTLTLFPHEARDLAAALQNLATHIDESVAR